MECRPHWRLRSALAFIVLPAKLAQKDFPVGCYLQGWKLEALATTHGWGHIRDVSSARECQHRCKETSDCRFFTYASSSFSCWLMNEFSSVHQDTSLVSGPANCRSSSTGSATSGPCSALPGSGFPGETAAQSHEAWPTGIVPTPLQCWPHQENGDLSPCSSEPVRVLEDTTVGWPGRCEQLQQVAVPDGGSCQSDCKDDVMCPSWQEAKDFFGRSNCWQGLGINCWDTSNEIQASTAQRFMHGHYRVLMDLKGHEVDNLRLVFGARLFRQNTPVAVMVCNHTCLSLLTCEMWTYSEFDGCRVNDPSFAKLAYPPTKGSFKRGTEASQYVVSGEYIQRLCGPSIDSNSVEASSPPSTAARVTWKPSSSTLSATPATVAPTTTGTSITSTSTSTTEPATTTASSTATTTRSRFASLTARARTETFPTLAPWTAAPSLPAAVVTAAPLATTPVSGTTQAAGNNSLLLGRVTMAPRSSSRSLPRGGSGGGKPLASVSFKPPTTKTLHPFRARDEARQDRFIQGRSFAGVYFQDCETGTKHLVRLDCRQCSAPSPCKQFETVSDQYLSGLVQGRDFECSMLHGGPVKGDVSWSHALPQVSQGTAPGVGPSAPTQSTQSMDGIPWLLWVVIIMLPCLLGLVIVFFIIARRPTKNTRPSRKKAASLADRLAREDTESGQPLISEPMSPSAPTSPVLQHPGPRVGPMSPDYSTAAGQPTWAFPGSPTGPAQLSPTAAWGSSTPPSPQVNPHLDPATITRALT
mmetsp:Transcript_59799/g.115357  ORF Transcript_59799/g.115357 Transcript_59799/m.115357 type:complete len:755 (-) Transcript_59799:184-2448(-)